MATCPPRVAGTNPGKARGPALQNPPPRRVPALTAVSCRPLLAVSRWFAEGGREAAGARKAVTSRRRAPRDRKLVVHFRPCFHSTPEAEVKLSPVRRYSTSKLQLLARGCRVLFWEAVLGDLDV